MTIRVGPGGLGRRRWANASMRQQSRPPDVGHDCCIRNNREHCTKIAYAVSHLADGREVGLVECNLVQGRKLGG